MGQYMSCLSNWTVRTHAFTWPLFLLLAKNLSKFIVFILKNLKYHKFCYSYDYLVTELRVVQFSL